MPKSSNVTRRYYFKEFICGWSAGCIETCLLYPFTKIIFRQQLHNVMLIDAIKQLKKEGTRNLYRGLLPPLLQRTTNRSIMFGTNEKYQRIFGCPPKGPSFCHAFCSFLAGATEACLCPLERVQALLQTSKHQDRFKNTGQAFKLILKEHQLKEFYRGFSMVVLRNGCSNIMFFSLREPLREFALNLFPRQSRSKSQNVIANFLSGGLLGGSISTIFFPFNVIKNRMQSNIGVDFCSPLRMFKIIMSERGWSLRALYRGSHLNFTRSMMTWGITNSIYEVLMREFFNEPI